MTALVDSYSFAMRFAFVPALDPSKPTAAAKKRGVLGSYGLLALFFLKADFGFKCRGEVGVARPLRAHRPSLGLRFRSPPAVRACEGRAGAFS